MTSFLPRFFAIFLISFISYAHAFGSAADSVSAWDFGGMGALHFNQVTLSNWAAGGESSFSVLGNVSLHTNYKKGKKSWNNTFDVVYGTVKAGDPNWRKSDDKFELNIKYGRSASSDWNYSGQFNFRSQFAPTYTIKDNEEIYHSDFLSPGVVQTSLGMDYKPNQKLSVLISPLTGKYTIVKNQLLADQGAFGVDKAQTDGEGSVIAGTGQHIRKEAGGYVNVRYKEEVLKNVALNTKLDLFSNYVRNTENIDVNWENNVNFKVNKFISASLFLHMIYDDDVLISYDSTGDGNKDSKGPRLQMKESFGLGLSYKLE
ncbi:DUF3078 domain-containing protein [Pontibacter harenae]|uniref:DUF3078 domain-containing protein n=1 Tax=Pontibacter harenae TaxID=2894083 RepID=UPI001E45C748|nr:DUF3078 domain-containing protein [Pontibacter harenae]MCC9166681.1 DUF3078 domain-containing protein [Pontibacter harenae]